MSVLLWYLLILQTHTSEGVVLNTGAYRVRSASTHSEKCTPVYRYRAIGVRIETKWLIGFTMWRNPAPPQIQLRLPQRTHCAVLRNNLGLYFAKTGFKTLQNLSFSSTCWLEQTCFLRIRERRWFGGISMFAQHRGLADQSWECPTTSDRHKKGSKQYNTLHYRQHIQHDACKLVLTG